MEFDLERRFRSDHLDQQSPFVVSIVRRYEKYRNRAVHCRFELANATIRSYAEWWGYFDALDHGGLSIAGIGDLDDRKRGSTGTTGPEIDRSRRDS
jgi:hypothetical protein